MKCIYLFFIHHITNRPSTLKYHIMLISRRKAIKFIKYIFNPAKEFLYLCLVHAKESLVNTQKIYQCDELLGYTSCVMPNGVNSKYSG